VDERTSEPILVTWRGRPLARIEPVREPTPVRRFGKQRGRMRIKGDIVRADFATGRLRDLTLVTADERILAYRSVRTLDARR
jgi:antitoxin (DNA-binding transcriptional repressor) of toxin-antitoxin stability system